MYSKQYFEFNVFVAVVRMQIVVICMYIYKHIIKEIIYYSGNVDFGVEQMPDRSV